MPTALASTYMHYLMLHTLFYQESFRLLLAARLAAAFISTCLQHLVLYTWFYLFVFHSL
jgi:hypothetical protein